MPKKLLVIGDSFFTNEPINRPGQHFSDMFGEGIAVVNAAAPGATNTQIISEALLRLNQENFDYVVMGFTVPFRLPIQGDSNISKTLIQWRSSAHLPTEQEEEITNNYLSILGTDETSVNGLLLIYSGLSLLREQYPDTRIAWSAGPMLPLMKHIKLGFKSDIEYQVLKGLKQYLPQMLRLDLWNYKPLVNHDPIWHIDNVDYQGRITSEFKKLLGIEQ